MSLNCSLKWSQEAKCCLDKSGIGSGYKSEVIFNMIFKRLMDTFCQEAFRDINRDGSKLRTFAKLKTDIGIAKYLTPSRHIALTKMRLSNHDLMIEKGRHLEINKTERFCPFCTDIVESEEHFLLHCTTFSPLRATLISEIVVKIAFPEQMSDHKKFIILLINETLF